jgi:hypothetical protein
MSSVGTPVHCVLLGIKRISRIAKDEVFGSGDNDDWLMYYDNREMKQGRAKVLDLLIGLGADFTLSYRAPNGSEYSCIELTFCAGIGTKEHPLLELVNIGVQLEDGFATRFMRASEICNTEASAKTTIEALIARLDKNPQTERVRSELFTIALQFQSSVASALFTSDVISVDMLYEAFRSATRFDQTNIVEKLLQDARLDPLASHGRLGETVLHEAAIHDAVYTLNFSYLSDWMLMLLEVLAPLLCMMQLRRLARMEMLFRCYLVMAHLLFLPTITARTLGTSLPNMAMLLACEPWLYLTK